MWDKTIIYLHQANIQGKADRLISNEINCII